MGRPVFCQAGAFLPAVCCRRDGGAWAEFFTRWPEVEYKDYYKTMGLAHDASQDEIKRAYRKLARKFHPDVSQEADAEARFKEVGEAYEVLKDPEKRVAYDRLDKQWKAGQEFHPPPDWDSGFEFRGGGYTAADKGVYSDFFEQLFGQQVHAGRRSAAGDGFRMHGEHHHAKVLINLEDSMFGATRSIALQVPELTGSGQLNTRQRTLNVRIPKGIRPGQQIRLTGQGGTGSAGAPAGDLYLEVAFHPHRLYRVDGADIYLNLPVAPWEAALGARVKAPTPAGEIDIKIPSESRQGSKLRLRGRGLPGKPAGDMYVVLQLVLPAADSEAAKALYRQMQTQLGFDPRVSMNED
jgi:curved DNA-binding protein